MVRLKQLKCLQYTKQSSQHYQVIQTICLRLNYQTRITVIIHTTNIPSYSFLCSPIHALNKYLLSTHCVPGGTLINTGVTVIQIKAHTLPSRSSQSNLAERCGNEGQGIRWSVDNRSLFKVGTNHGFILLWVPQYRYAAPQPLCRARNASHSFNQSFSVTVGIHSIKTRYNRSRNGYRLLTAEHRGQTQFVPA